MESVAEKAIKRLRDQAGLGAGSELELVVLAILNRLESDQSVATYTFDIAAWLRFCAERGLAPLAATRDDLAAYAARLRHSRLAPDTRRRTTSVLRSLYGEAIERGARQGANPVAAMGRVKAEAPPGEPALSRADAAKLLGSLRRRAGEGTADAAALRCLRDAVMCGFMIWQGLRVGEVVGLRGEDLRRIDGRDVVIVRGKGGSKTVMRLHRELTSVIAEYRTALAVVGVATRTSDPLFFGLGTSWPPRPRRRAGALVPLTTRAVAKMVKRELRPLARTGHRSGPHLLRRTSVTLVYQGSHDMFLAQRHARHANSATTTRHYIKPLDELGETGVDYLDLPLEAHS